MTDDVRDIGGLENDASPIYNKRKSSSKGSGGGGGGDGSSVDESLSSTSRHRSSSQRKSSSRGNSSTSLSRSRSGPSTMGGAAALVSAEYEIPLRASSFGYENEPEVALQRKSKPMLSQTTTGYKMSGPGGTRGKSVRAMDERHVRQLMSQGFSTGLAKALATNAMTFDHRIWVVDNSGSMQIGDGHRILGAGKKEDIRAVPSTRWEEIQDTVEYHAGMAALLDSPTIFKLLNDPGSRVGPQQFSISERGEAMIQDDINIAMEVMRKAKPGGVTPLTRHIWEIQQSVQEMAPQLVKDGKKIVVVLATDGLPTDEQGYGGEYITDEFIRALRSLEGLPVWLVVRLCTDEEPVTRFYNNLDGQLELSLEVLDDFIGEAREVYRCNKWLNYALPMHRCRELGYHDRLFDLIDERKLTKGEIRDFCCLLFGVDTVDGIPDPGADWQGFIKTLQTLLKNEKPQWNPMKKKLMPWINIKVLNKEYGQKSSCSIM